MGRLFNVTHRHITFTVADKLWPLLEFQPAWRKVLFPAANAALRRAMKNVPGMVMVMHPYGKDLKVVNLRPILPRSFAAKVPRPFAAKIPTLLKETCP